MSFSDWTKKRKQNNTTTATGGSTGGARATASPSAASVRDDTPSSFGEWTRKKRGVTAWREEEKGINEFLERLGTFSQRVSDDYSQREGVYQSADTLGEYRDKTYQTIDSFTRQSGQYRDYFTTYRDQYDEMYGEGTVDGILSALDEGDSYLGSVRSDLGSEYDYWAQFEDEAAYNGYLEQQKEYERLSGLDLDELRASLEELNGQLEEAEQAKTTASNMMVGINRYGTQAQREQYGADLEEKTAIYDDLQSQVTALQRDIQQAEDIQKGQQYSAYLNEGDFAQYSAQGADIENPALADVEKGITIFGRNFGGEKPGNIVTYSRDNWQQIALGEANNSQMTGRSLYHYMTDDEVGIYNYLLAKNGEAAAQEYLDYLEETLNYRFGTAQGENIRGIENDAGRTAMTALYGLGAGLDQFGSGVRQLFSSERLPTTATQFGSAYIREDLAETGPQVLGSSLGQMGYDALTTTANMAPSILVSALTGGLGAPGAFAAGAGAVTLGASASGNAYNMAVNEGYTEDEARNYAVLVGASEAGLQYLLGGIGSLGGKVTGKTAQMAVQNIDNALLRISAEIGINMAGEGAEEYLQEILEPVFRNLVFDENNEIKLVSEEAAYSFMLGALTAGLMEGGHITASDIDLGKTGAAIKNAGQYEALLENALALDPSSEAYKMASGMQGGSLHASDINIGQLLAAYAEAGGNLDFMATPTAEAEQQTTTATADDLLAEAAAQVAQGGTVTNRTAERILADQGAVSALGMTVDSTMTRSQQRAAVKSAVASLASRESGTDGAPATSTPTQPVTAQTATQTRSVAQQAHDIRGVQRAASALGKNGAKALTAAYDGSVAADTFYGAFAAYYEAGVSGMDMGKVRSEYSAQLNEAQKYAAYVAGQNDAAASLAREQWAAQYAQVAGTDSGLVFDDYVADILNAATAERVNSVAKLLGLRVRFVDSVRGGTANAQISGSEVLVERNNPNPVMFLLGHEWTHRLQELAPTEYRAFREAVAEEVQGEARDLLEHYRRAGEDISYEDALDEAAANYAGRMIEDSALLDQFIEKHRDNRSMLEKVRDAIRTLISKLTGAERRAAQTAEGKLTAALEAAAGQAGKLEANKNAAPEGGEQRFSIKRTSQMTLAAQLKMFYDGKMASSDAFYFGETPDTLAAAGLDPLPLAFTVADFRKSAREKHNVPRRVWKNLHESLENALFAFRLGDRVGIMTGDIDGDGKPLLVGVERNAVMDRKPVNAIRSVYGLDNPGPWLQNQFKSGKEYIPLNKQRADAFLQTYGAYSASVGDGIRSLDGTVTQNEPESKGKFSLKEDSQGRELTEEQREYFRDSKAVDGRGRLLTLYHQTEGLFTVFDPRHQGAGSRDNATPFGIFLKTSDRDIGLKGKFQMELYANITNPLYASNREALTYGLLKLSDEYATIKAEIDTLDATYHEKFEQAKQKLRDFMTEWRNKNPGASRRALYDVPEFNALYEAEDAVVEEWTQKADQLSAQAKNAITAALRNAGYDGVILSTDAGSFGHSTDAYIALDPEQVKNASNKKPTSDPDIRYSLKRATNSEIASAEEMESEGATREDIWAELGVIRDAAGNWVSEINDAQMKYHRDGDARFTQAHPEYAEYQGLMQKMFYGSLTDEEYERLQRLDEMWGREIGRLSERVDRGNATLEDILEFDELFATYPQLRNINVRFADLKETRERASFNQRTNTITLDESLRSSPESTLLHEIQHAIQHLEKRPTGASVEYWQDRMAAGETFREHDTEIAQARRRMDAAWDKMPEDLKNRVREINRESIRAKETGDYDRLTELQEVMFNSEDGDLYAEYDNALWEIRLYSENNAPMSAEDLYYRTAGEIEARLVQQRRRMTAEERRANMPDLGWDRAVFSRNGPRNYSLKGSESSREAAALQEENNLLRERVEYWKGQTRRTKRVTTDKKAVTRAARELIRSYGADLETTDISGELQSLYDYIASGYDGNDELTYTEARRRAEAIAEKLVESAVTVDDDMYQQYSDLRSYLRTTKLTISEEDSHNIADYGDFRKRNMGRMTLTKGNTNIDRVYEEMAELWPEFFDPQRETHPADQLAHIAEVMDGIYDITEYNPFSRYMEQAVADAANEVMEMFFDLPQTRATFADRQARKLDDAKAKGRQQVQKVREEGAARLEELRKQNREKVRQTIEKERQRRETEIGKLKTRYREKDAAGRERRNARELRAKIVRHVNALSQKLLRPSDKQHIPEKLRQATAAALEAINLESAYSVDPATGRRVKDGTGTPTKRTEAFRQLRLAYADITKEGGDYTLIIDPDLMDNLNELEAMKDTPLMEMGTAQLATVWATVKAVEASIRTANKMLGQTRFQTISQFADGIKGDNLTRKDRGDFRGVAGWLDKKTNFDMLTPQGYFHRLGKTGEEMFRMMRSAQDRHIEIMRQAQEATRKITGKADINKLERETHTFDLEGGKLTMSTAQIMALYELMKRQQAQDHILKGGIRPETISSRKGLRESRKADPVRVSLEDIATITGVLTEEQRRMADGLQKFMGGDLAELGNEASMEVYGYRKFNERDYFPIQVDKNQTKRDIAKEAQAATIAGRGFTKSVTPHANNAVMLNSIFDVYASHVNDMATYAAWLPTMENIRRIRDFTFRDEEGNRTGDVKSIIERVFGKNGNPYLNKLVDDINQGIKPSGTGGMNALVGNYKAAAVAANLRVILQQPTAILRALDGISPKYLLAGTVKRGDWEKVMKYAPIARWKDWGYFDINTGRQMKDVLLNSDSALEKVKQASMAPAGKADSFAWARLWNAVEAETKDKRPGLKPGTDAFYRAVADRFSEIVDRTQVVDGLLQRSQIMRSPDALDKMATSFMGEPTKTYNMFVNAVYDLRHAEGKDGRKRAKRSLARTATALVTSFAINAVMQSIVDALRDDDKERDYWEKMLAAYTGFTGDEETFLDYWNSFWDGNLQANFNPLGYIPYAKDILSIAQGYDVSRMDMEPVSKVWEAAVNMKKALSGEGKHSLAGASANLVAEVARLLGIPVANLKRDVQACVTTAAIETDNYLMQYRIDKTLLNMGYSGNTGNFLDILYNASVNDPEAYEIIYADMVASGIPEDKIRNGMESRMKKAQGVESVADLESRYLTPAQMTSYERVRGRVTGTTVWNAASAAQREVLEDDLYALTVGNSDGLKLREKIDGGAAYGIDEADYLLYRLALRVADQPSESGKLGSYTGDEVEAAIDMLPGLDDEARAYLWEAAGKSENSNPYK